MRVGNTQSPRFLPRLGRDARTNRPVRLAAAGRPPKARRQTYAAAIECVELVLDEGLIERARQKADIRAGVMLTAGI